MPDLNNYANSFGEYVGLLCKPNLNSGMFKCDHANWVLQFQAWNVIYVDVYIILTLIDHFSDYGDHEIEHTIINILVFLLLTHLGWFCITKANGCCGSIGFLVWALIYLVKVFMPLLHAFEDHDHWHDHWHHVHLLYLLMLVPAGYMTFSCFKLFAKTAHARTKPLLAS